MSKNLSIAYAIQSKNKRKNFKNEGEATTQNAKATEEKATPISKTQGDRTTDPDERKKAIMKHFAKGGPVDHENFDEDGMDSADSSHLEEESPISEHESDIDSTDYSEERHKSMADAIISKRASMFAEGGTVDLDEESEESPNTADEDNYDALKKEQYDDSQISKQPMDSNEHSIDIESDMHDLVSKVMAKMKSKRSE